MQQSSDQFQQGVNSQAGIWAATVKPLISDSYKQSHSWFLMKANGRCLEEPSVLCGQMCIKKPLSLSIAHWNLYKGSQQTVVGSYERLYNRI